MPKMLPKILSTRIPHVALGLALLACSPTPTPTETAVDVPKTTDTQLVTPATPEPATAPTKSSLPSLTLQTTDKEAMTAELEAWLASIPTPLRLSWGDAELRYDPRAKSHRLHHDGWTLFVGFDAEARTAADAGELAERFSYWGLDDTFAPIAAEGWTFLLQTPQSSTDEGFEVLSYRDGVAKLRIEGRFFALWARHDETDDCRLMADAPAPEHCYVNVEKSIPFELVVEAKIVD